MSYFRVSYFRFGGVLLSAVLGLSIYARASQSINTLTSFHDRLIYGDTVFGLSGVTGALVSLEFNLSEPKNSRMWLNLEGEFEDSIAFVAKFKSIYVTECGSKVFVGQHDGPPGTRSFEITLIDYSEDRCGGGRFGIVETKIETMEGSGLKTEALLIGLALDNPN